jgi:hypothetical protein
MEIGRVFLLSDGVTLVDSFLFEGTKMIIYSDELRFTYVVFQDQIEALIEFWEIEDEAVDLIFNDEIPFRIIDDRQHIAIHSN